MAESDEKRFDKYLSAYRMDEFYQADDRCFEALATKAKEFGRFDEETMEFINKEENNE